MSHLIVTLKDPAKPKSEVWSTEFPFTKKEQLETILPELKRILTKKLDQKPELLTEETISLEALKALVSAVEQKTIQVKSTTLGLSGDECITIIRYKKG